MDVNDWKTITKLELLQHYKDGYWHEEVGELYGVSGRTVRTKAKEFEIVLPRKNAKKVKEVVSSVCVQCGKEFTRKVNTKISKDFCSFNCQSCKEHIESSDLNKDVTSELGKNILSLRKQGLTYNQIVEKLDCAKSTVAYYCNSTTKERMIEKNHERKEEEPAKYRFLKQITNFKADRYSYKPKREINMCLDWNKKFRTSCSRFRLREGGILNMDYTYQDAIKHLGGMQTKCYLTGREINLEEDDFHLDHIIPVSKGGSNELENMGITIPNANKMKSDLELDELFSLCKEILENNGYTVNKNI